MSRKRTDAPRLEAALQDLERLAVGGLRLRWQALQGSAAPPGFREALLRAALAYTLQERALGGLRPGTRSLLRRVAEQAELQRRGRAATGATQHEAAAPPGPAPADTAGMAPGRITQVRQPPARIKPGTRLLRSWQGTTHEVLVGEGDVTYRGRSYRSLSEVARAITGQRWSGPLFFGLRRRAPEPATAAPATPAKAGP